MFAGPFDDSIIRRAQEASIISIGLHNIRDYAEGKHLITDDYPYGGGGGMVMKPEPIFRRSRRPGHAHGPLEASAAAEGAHQPRRSFC